MPSTDIKPRFINFDGPVVKGNQGYFSPQYEREALKASVLMAIGTLTGDRVHRRNYGSQVLRLVMEQNDLVLNDLAYEYISEALIHEPRVHVLGVKATKTDTQLDIKMSLAEVNSNDQFEMQFGFNL